MSIAPFESWAFPSGRNRDACGVGAISAGTRRPGRTPLELALRAICHLEHRGACMPDGTGDGAGLLMDIPRRFFDHALATLSPGADPLFSHAIGAVVSLFVPRDLPIDRVEHTLREACEPLGAHLVALRTVPIVPQGLGAAAREGQPCILQAILRCERLGATDPRTLFVVQRRIEDAFADLSLPVYVASCSDRTLVYKGLMDGALLPRVFPDLLDPAFEVGTVVFHRRFATNTEPNWNMCQPFRVISHNGEINTVSGNRHAVVQWERYVRKCGKFDEAWPAHALVPGQSDTADLDGALQAYHAEGRSLAYTVAALMPPSWENRVRNLTPERKALFEFHKRAMGGLGAWEGPAALIAYDGIQLVASLDRMGLRPLRVMRTGDGLFLVSSEIGVFDRDPREIDFQKQLAPGEIVRFDLESHRVVESSEVYFEIVAEATPWLGTTFDVVNQRDIRMPTRYGARVDLPHPDLLAFRGRLGAFLRAWGWDSRMRQETTDHLIDAGKEEIYSMGFDRALPCLSVDGPTLYRFFQQKFALVTNPPIDPYREGRDMSLVTYLGRQPDVPPRTSPQAVNMRLRSPVLTARTVDELLSMHELGTRKLSLSFLAGGDGRALAGAVDGLISQAVEAVRAGASVLLLSDMGCFAEQRWPIPAPLAVAAVNDHLTEEGLRPLCSIVVQSGEVSEGHDIAVLLGLGADAVHAHALLHYAIQRAKAQNRPVGSALRKTQEGLEESLRKILSKMGIATIQGYVDACLFEAVGLGPDVMRYLRRVPSRVGGIDLDTVASDTARRVRHALVIEDLPRFDHDERTYNDNVRIALWEVACAKGPEAWERYATLADVRRPAALRDLLEFQTIDTPTVEAATAVDVLRDCVTTGGMSLGALTAQAHEAIAHAANAIGMLSNSGEGGEARDRNRDASRRDLRSRIRQVATGRFGVDAEYLVHADEIQIKMAQGAKPGEGGQLMSSKVTEEIARLRYCRSGIDLISPPPHHDIYSIEDLKQLIHDLRAVHPAATLSVKLCAVTGIGTIAAGVVKAGADIIEIDGLEGSTGASPRSSLEHAGLPTELGLRETHLALTALGLRGLVKLRAGGGVKTETDAIKLMLLGADQVTIATALMIAQGCVHCNLCHTGACPTLIAGQLNPRAVYPGSAEHVKRFLLEFGAAIGRLAARLGFSHPKALVGRSDLLCVRSASDLASTLPDAYGVDTAALLRRVSLLDLSMLTATPPHARAFRATGRIDGFDRTIVEQLDRDQDLLDALESGRSIQRTFTLTSRSSIDFAVSVAGRIARRWGRDGWPHPQLIQLRTYGTAGQSYGAFCIHGLELVHSGSCNDGVGKAMSGGRIVVRQPEGFVGKSWETTLVGNTVAFGATGGTIFVQGRAGQRLAVRNSGATIVCEGAGEYACEYMSAGRVVLLGPASGSIGAGMTDGVIYVYDPEGSEDVRFAVDSRSVAVVTPSEVDRYEELLPLLDAYYEATRSERAREARQNLYDFHKVIPNAALMEETRRQLAVDVGGTIAG